MRDERHPAMRDERRFTHLPCGQIHVRREESDDDAIAAIASRQHGVVARWQLHDVTVGRRAIEHRRRAGRLRTLYPGVYAVGHDALSYAGRVLAAVIAVAPPTRAHQNATVPSASAAASHVTVAAVRALCDPPGGPVHVTVTERRQPRYGVALHRAVLPPDEVEVVGGIPVTTIPRTLLDISATGNEGRLRRLVKEAEFQGLTDLAELEAILRRYPRRRGRRTLARIVERYQPSGKTRSEIEDRFFEFCVERRIPLPETNVMLKIRGHRLEVDCLWRDAGLVVELDGRQAHDTATGFEDDRARDRTLIAGGLVPMRVTWAHLRRDRDALEADIRDALGRVAAATKVNLRTL